MNRALITKTDAEREADMAEIYRIFGADLDMDEEAHVDEMRAYVSPFAVIVIIAAGFVALALAVWFAGVVL